MARPKIEKCICSAPQFLEFVAKDNTEDNESVVMSYEEYETILLIDYKHLQQEDCASRMGVSRTTVQFLYTSARNKLADLLVNGKPLEIEGGNYKMCEDKNIDCQKGYCRKCNADGQD